ncbi:MAG TPA: hypothetical protein VGM44_02475 [Polyangiaceae bacterium]|jgi:hypothetical protein
MIGSARVEGDLDQGESPMKHSIEVYRLNQPDGGIIALAFNQAHDFPATRAEAFFSAFAKSLQRTDLKRP